MGNLGNVVRGNFSAINADPRIPFIKMGGGVNKLADAEMVVRAGMGAIGLSKELSLGGLDEIIQSQAILSQFQPIIPNLEIRQIGFNPAEYENETVWFDSVSKRLAKNLSEMDTNPWFNIKEDSSFGLATEKEVKAFIKAEMDQSSAATTYFRRKSAIRISYNIASIIMMTGMLAAGALKLTDMRSAAILSTILFIGTLIFDKERRNDRIKQLSNIARAKQLTDYLEAFGE